MRTALRLALAFTALCVDNAMAQSVGFTRSALQPGDVVRISIVGAGREGASEFVAQDRDTIWLRIDKGQVTSSELRAIPVASVSSLEVRQRRPGTIGAWGGAALGLIAGIALGAALAAPGCQGDYCGIGTTVYGLLGGAAGMLVGAIFGHSRTHHWVPLRLEIP